MNLHGFLTDEIKVTRVSNAVAAGTTDIEASSVNMAGWDGVVFVALFGTLTATQVTTLKAQQSSDDGVADGFSDLAGTATGPMADDDDNQVAMLDIVRPGKQYVRPVIDRGTANAVVDGILAIQYRARSVPTTQDATTVAFTEQHHAPAEGTA